MKLGRLPENYSFTPEDQRLILDVLAFVRLASGGNIDHISDDNAERIVWVRRAYPEMPIDDAWQAVRRIRSHEGLMEIATEYLAHDKIRQPYLLKGPPSKQD